MMRKFNKKKSSRRGAILVTVVFVLAFATIFIAAAMTLTQATRKRVYQEAYSDQARLTVTSVAEAWYRAVNMCEFEDASIIKLCEGSGTTIHVVAPTAADRIPGMEVDGSTDPNNCTTVFFHRDHVGTGTTDDKYTYYADFTTNIGGHKENVRSVLTYTLPANPTGGKPFNAQFDFNSPINQTNMTEIGKGSDSLDNIFLARQGGKNKNSGNVIYSTMVYCDGAVAFKAEEFYSEDMVFLTGAYFKQLDDSTQPNVMKVKNFFFFGSSGEAISDGNSSNWKADSSMTFYLCNRTNTGNWSGSANVINVRADGGKTSDPEGTSTLPESIQKKIVKYASYNVSYAPGGKEPFPTTDTFLKSAKKLGISKTHPSDATEVTLGKYLTENAYQSKKGFAKEGTFFFKSDGSENDQDKHTKLTGMTEDFKTYEPYVIVLDGTKDYKFYFAKGTFGLRNVVFIINKPSTSHPAVFVLEDGAKIYWPYDKYNTYNDCYTSSNSVVASNGIIATQSRNFDTAKAAYEFVIKEFGRSAAGAKTNFDKDNYSSSMGWSKYYDAKNEACAMVVGMGNNVFAIDKNFVLESFVGLFNKDYGKGNSSVFRSRNGQSNLLYGRLMTDGYDDWDGGGLVMPASPGSSNVDGVDPGFKKLKTNFSLVKMVYYYNLTSNKS